MSIIVLEAEARTELGKGASRRLRRLENKVPGILYGGDKKPLPIYIPQNKVIKALESESIYSSVFDLKVDGKVVHVILKDLQRHPYKPVILHMDLQRVSAKDVLVKNVPIHFLNEDSCKGIKQGGRINHTMNQIEVRCQAKDLPEFIEIDLANLELNEVLHLSNVKLPKGVQLTVSVNDPEHDLPIVNIHPPKGSSEDVEDQVDVSAGDVPASAEKPEENA